MEFLYEYGLFLAKAATIVMALLIVFGAIAANAMKQKQDSRGELEITSISDKLEDISDHARQLVLSKGQLKAYEKEQKKKAKAEKKADKKDAVQHKPNLFVIDFNGSMDAHEVEDLREEVTAVLLIAQKEDEVLVRLESGGGVVHGYGLASSQLQRIKDKGIKLTVAVDKVAASGGYMMACVADNLLAARFAIIGSIGVIAQLPNFNKLLKKHDVEFEQHTAGEYKRTLTMFGENDEQGREKFKQELAEIHVAFKSHIQQNRPKLEMDKVATGEYWHGEKAHELGLVDALQTSDDYLLTANEDKQIYAVKFQHKKKVAERLGLAVSAMITSALNKLVSRVELLNK